MKHKNILITGGAGFIGSHVLRHFVNKYKTNKIFNLDCLTYAGNLENIVDIAHFDNYKFLKIDLNDRKKVFECFKNYNYDAVIHMAAESHVDRSIETPSDFVKANIIGTTNLLDACLQYWKDFSGKLFYHISTDEVYGALGKTGYFTENTAYNPSSPYAASKAASDHFVRAYHNTYGLPVVLSNCSNNYGPNQFPEKLIPLCINNIQKQKPLPIYGDGKQVRDWLFVKDHVDAIEHIFKNGKLGETYNVGGNNEVENIQLVGTLCDVSDQLTGKPAGTSRQLITHVDDRLGHDRRYAIDASKLKTELGWQPKTALNDGLKRTIKWYMDNKQWLEHIASGAYKKLQ